MKKEQQEAKQIIKHVKAKMQEDMYVRQFVACQLVG